jgi:hypothetical protein
MNTITISGGAGVQLHGVGEGVGLVKRRELTEVELLENDRRFMAWGAALGWKWADNMGEMIDRELDREARQMELGVELPRERWLRTRRAVRRYAEGRGIKLSGALLRVGTANFFPMEARRAELSIDHHTEVWARGFDLAASVEWLEKAVQGKWTPKELRGEIRRVRAQVRGERGVSESGDALGDVALAVAAIEQRVREELATARAAGELETCGARVLEIFTPLFALVGELRGLVEKSPNGEEFEKCKNARRVLPAPLA